MPTDRPEVRSEDDPPRRGGEGPRRSDSADYDALSDQAQEALRALWDEQIALRIDAFDLTDRLQPAGRPWPEADDQGRVVMRDARD